MKKDIDKKAGFIVRDFMIPVVKLLGVYEISSYYSYLPGEIDDPEDLAPFYYLRELNKIRDSITSCDYISLKLQKRMLKLWLDVRTLISSCEGVDSLRHKWLKANPRLNLYKAEFQLSTGLYGQIDERYEIRDMIIAFISLSFSMIDGSELKAAVKAGLGPYIDCVAFKPLTEEEKDELRLYASRERNDAKAIEAEAKKRNKMLQKIFGKLKDRRLSGRAEYLRNKIRDEKGFQVYRVIEDDEKIILLCITREVLYWENQRPYDGPVGTYAFGYIEHKDPCEEDGYGQICLSFLKDERRDDD